jgi:hypothetical protein
VNTYNDVTCTRRLPVVSHWYDLYTCISTPRRLVANIRYHKIDVITATHYMKVKEYNGSKEDKRSSIAIHDDF